MEKKLRIGFIGCGWIADWACTGIREAENATASAVLARNPEKMKAFTEKYEIPFYTDSMEEFLKKEKGVGVHLDAVYVATTNESHFTMAMKALRAGFPVFLEKPVTMSAAQARALKEEAQRQKVFLMEGMWPRFLPAQLLLREMIRAGEIGKIIGIETAVYCKMNPVDNARVFKMETGGGALIDVGIYAVSLLRYLTGQNPESVHNQMEFYETGVDIGDEVTYTYRESEFVKGGAKAHFRVVTSDWGNSAVTVSGERGSILMDDLSDAQSLVLEKDGERRLIRAAHGRWRFTYQLEHFADCILEGRKESWVIPFAESCEIMETMERTLEAGGLVYPGELTGIEEPEERI